MKITKAELVRSFDSMGKMDPFAVVEWVSAFDDSRWEMSRTPTHWSGHMMPQWNHTTRSQDFFKGDVVEVSVLERDLVSSELCGKARVSVLNLVPESKLEAGKTLPIVCEAKTLNLDLNGEHTGTVTV